MTEFKGQHPDAEDAKVSQKAQKEFNFQMTSFASSARLLRLLRPVVRFSEFRA
jgi:hypothetical protein